MRDATQGTLHTNDKYKDIRDQQLAARARADYLLPSEQSPLLKPQPEVKTQGTILNVQPEAKVESTPPPALVKPRLKPVRQQMSIAMRVDLMSGVAVEPESGLPAPFALRFRQRHGVLALGGERRWDRHRLPTGCQVGAAWPNYAAISCAVAPDPAACRPVRAAVAGSL